MENRLPNILNLMSNQNNAGMISVADISIQENLEYRHYDDTDLLSKMFSKD